MEIFILATIIILGIVLDWWEKNQKKIPQYLNDTEGIIAKQLGYVVIDHHLTWSTLSFREREICPKGTTVAQIQIRNNAFAIRIMEKHKLLDETGVNWRWEYV